MEKAKPEPDPERLICQRCGGSTMFVLVLENEAEKVTCAACSDTVAYTSNLMRVLVK